MKTAQISNIIVATVMLLGILTFSLHARPLGHAGDQHKKRLSDYMIDTDFLEECARKHHHAIATSPIIAPEIRIAILQRVAATAE